jgi:hypothetical protein
MNAVNQVSEANATLLPFTIDLRSTKAFISRRRFSLVLRSDWPSTACALEIASASLRRGAIQAEQFPVAAVGRRLLWLRVFVMNCQLMQLLAGKLASGHHAQIHGNISALDRDKRRRAPLAVPARAGQDPPNESLPPGASSLR